MTKEQLALLGLPETATEEQATAALNLMKGRADNAEQIQLAAVTQAVVKRLILQRVSPTRPAPRELRQVLIEAAVPGRSGAM